jgi:substrate import-associated zinc metallohydrolase lipoprotein
LICFTGLFFSCGNEDALNDRSIFDTEPPVRNEFDNWLLKNYTIPYNVDFKYRLDDIESSQTHTLAPAEYDKSVALAKLTKFLWFESYDEVAGVEFTRSNVPRMIHLVGSPAYNSEGTITLGTAEGGLKVTLYMVNYIDLEDIDLPFLNYYYFKTMHHEFAHILNQTIEYDPDFDLISEADYISGDWYQISDAEANSAGFVTPYAMSEPTEDFAENIAVYVTATDAEWNRILTNAGPEGSGIILRKFDIVYNYMKSAWNIDLDKLREVVQRRSGEIHLLDLDNL